MMHRARRCWIVVMVCALAGCGGEQTATSLKKLDVQSRLDIASAAATAGVGAVATNLLAEAAAAAPDRAEVQQRYVRALVDAGRLSEARLALAKAVQRLPNDLALRYETARLDILDGAPKRALRPLEQILRAQPKDVPAWCAKAVAFDLLSESAAADEAYERAESLAPYDRIVANNRAVSLLLRGKLEPARDLLRVAASQNPPNHRIAANLALADGLAGNANGLAGLLDGAEANMSVQATHIVGSSETRNSGSIRDANDAGPQN